MAGRSQLAMLDSEVLVIVEIRSRGLSGFSTAIDSVDRRKQMHRAHAASQFLDAHP